MVQHAAVAALVGDGLENACSKVCCVVTVYAVSMYQQDRQQCLHWNKLLMVVLQTWKDKPDCMSGTLAASARHVRDACCGQHESC